MCHFVNLIALFILITIVDACKKQKETTGCFPNASTVRQISNKKAVIKLTATVNPVWLIEQGSIDTKLIPCNFPMEFYEDGLAVIISGEVKSTATVASEPCCNENFVITKISR